MAGRDGLLVGSSEGLTRARSASSGLRSLGFLSLTLPKLGSTGRGCITSSSSRDANSFFLLRPMLLYQGRRPVVACGVTSAGDPAWLAAADSPTTTALSSKLTLTDFLRGRGASSCEPKPVEASEVSSDGDAPRDGLGFIADFRGDMDRGGGLCLTIRFSDTEPNRACLGGLFDFVRTGLRSGTAAEG